MSEAASQEREQKERAKVCSSVLSFQKWGRGLIPELWGLGDYEKTNTYI